MGPHQFLAQLTGMAQRGDRRCGTAECELRTGEALVVVGQESRVRAGLWCPFVGEALVFDRGPIGVDRLGRAGPGR